MTTPAPTGVSPSKEDMELARASGPQLALLARGERSLTLRIGDAGTEATIELPAGAVKLLHAILENMATGRAVSVVPQNNELTFEQTADFLNVSHPFLIGLLVRKKLPFRPAGTEIGSELHIRFEDILRYKENIDAERRKALGELAGDAQDLKMGY